MTTTIAFLRGINVGGRRVKMDRLREIFEGMGFAEVSTFIASGNVIFNVERDATTEAALAERIAAGLEAALGFDVDVMLRTPDEVAAISAATAALPSHTALQVVFLADALTGDDRAALEALRTDVDDFYFREREVFWVLQCKISESPLFSTGIERVISGTALTSRNVNTVRRILEKVRAS